MRRKMGYRWQLRQLMAARGMFQTSHLGPLLAERGIHLSREQVYRLVAGTPQRVVAGRAGCAVRHPRLHSR
jgi:hypothetical protein